MRSRAHLFRLSYWRKRRRRFVAQVLVRTAVDFRDLPLVAVTGTNGKTGVSLLINRILMGAGYRTGCSCTEGVLIDGRWVLHGDYAGPNGLWRTNREPGVDALVAETARGGILRAGLGFSACHVSVVTNVFEDHLGQDGVNTVEDLAAIKSILPEHTRPNGVTVLNGDQPLVRDMARRSPARPVYFTLGEPLEAWEHCFFLRDGTIFRKRGAELERVLAADRIFVTHGGAVTFQIANAMAALAVTEALQPWLPVARASLEHSLATFGSDPRDLPGRMQLFRYQGADVLLSSSKNPETYAQEIALLRRLAQAHGYRRVISILSNVGNRQEVHYRTISRAVGLLGDVVACVPPIDEYLRGRTGNEIVELLASEIPPDKVARPGGASFAELVARFQPAGSEPTLFIAFATGVSGAIDLEDVLARGELLPMRFDA